MARKIDRTLLSYCPDLQIMDCTLRDGGLVNDFHFSDEFVKALYQANIKSGVDYMEFGYKASKNIFSVDDFGNGNSVMKKIFVQLLAKTIHL